MAATTSDFWHRVSTSTNSTPYLAARSAEGFRVHAMTSMPMTRPSSINPLGNGPRAPRTPRVLPYSWTRAP